MTRIRGTDLLALLLLFPTPYVGAQPVLIPKESDGYQITGPPDRSTNAPAGWRGRTDVSEQTAVGITEATKGKRVVTRFLMANQIKICPSAEGDAEGYGEFAITVESTNADASGTSTTSIAMQAKARYKGKVGVDAWLEGPVAADIAFTYKQTGTMRAPSGAVATPAGSDIVQNIHVDFEVARGIGAPSIGAFSGGDPTAGRYGAALDVGQALTYWAGVFYSEAQTQWRSPGLCVDVSFDPPSHSRQPALLTETVVKAEVKTKSGAVSDAVFANARVRGGAGAVSPPGGPSRAGAPLAFTYRAPEKVVPNAGFAVDATSRAGVAEGEWRTGLGTGWSGQISCTRSNASSRQNALQTGSFSQATRIVIDVKDGVGTANGYAESFSSLTSKRGVSRGGPVVLVFDYGHDTTGAIAGTSKGSVTVNLDPGTGRYSVGLEYGAFADGVQQTTSCQRATCDYTEAPLPIASCFGPGPSGQTDDPNRLSGTLDLARTPLGPAPPGAVWTVNWDLAREGTTR